MPLFLTVLLHFTTHTGVGSQHFAGALDASSVSQSHVALARVEMNRARQAKAAGEMRGAFPARASLPRKNAAEAAAGGQGGDCEEVA